ncbi:unnamed protein product, partial [Ectocarpus sp. 8 AP-2014]
GRGESAGITGSPEEEAGACRHAPQEGGEEVRGPAGGTRASQAPEGCSAKEAAGGGKAAPGVRAAHVEGDSGHAQEERQGPPVDEQDGARGPQA